MQIPRGPPEDPTPVMHSPPRKVTVADQEAWKIPPSISNWKNAKGYTIPLDKRLAADGRGLQEVGEEAQAGRQAATGQGRGEGTERDHESLKISRPKANGLMILHPSVRMVQVTINPKFAALPQALYIAEEKARENIAARAKIDAKIKKLCVAVLTACALPRA